ncbi:hypothetical protein ACSFA8_19305, partial [Variovorax sp. RT4R15]|uniref:hypothetical protein n=1 Tax=Variovorax sp. RT4R15 TaxID=3443737 RepID=UPI003F48D268
MGSPALLTQLESPLSSYTLDTPVVQVLLAGLSSPTDYGRSEQVANWRAMKPNGVHGDESRRQIPRIDDVCPSSNAL